MFYPSPPLHTSHPHPMHPLSLTRLAGCPDTKGEGRRTTQTMNHLSCMDIVRLLKILYCTFYLWYIWTQYRVLHELSEKLISLWKETYTLEESLQRIIFWGAWSKDAWAPVMQVAGLFCIHAIYRKLETFLILEMAENQCGQVQNKQNNKMVIPRHSLTSYSLCCFKRLL